MAKAASRPAAQRVIQRLDEDYKPFVSRTTNQYFWVKFRGSDLADIRAMDTEEYDTYQAATEFENQDEDDEVRYE